MRPDDLEFLIAQYADGSLDAKRSTDLEAILRRDGGARALLASYRAVDGALAGVVSDQPVPEIHWDRLEASIRGSVTVATSTDALTDEAEEVLSRLSSGGLTEQEARAISVTALADPRSRLALADYAALDRVFDAVRASPMPAVRWDRLAAHLSAEIASADNAAADAMRIRPRQESDQELSSLAQARVSARQVGAREGVIGRIGAILSQPRRLAIAACLLVAASVSFKLINQGGPAPTNNPAGPNLGGTPAPVAGGPVVTVTPAPMDIRVGPSVVPGMNPGGNSVVTSIHVGPPTGPGFDVAVLADWARDFPYTQPSQSSIGKAATRPEGRSSPDSVENDASFPPR